MKKFLHFLALAAMLCIPWVTQAQQSLPYNDGFESYSSGLPTGWTKVGSGTVSVQTSYVNTGSKSLKFNGATSNVVALPQFTAEINTLQITIFTRPEGTYSSSKDFDIGYITDLNDASTFVAIATYNYSEFSGSYLEKGPVSMASAPTGAYIAFRHRPNSGSYYWFVDDITVEAIPACPKPTALAANGITHEAATFSWTEGGSATNWVLQVATNNTFTENLQSINITTTPTHNLTGLTPLTTYYARVEADCGGEQSEWSNVISFSTTAVAEAVGDLWSDNFDGASCGWELINGTCTNAWAWGTAANNGGTHALYISNDAGTTNAYTVGSAGIVYATKLLNFTDGKFEFSYDWQANGESSFDYLRVALVPASVTLTANASTSVPSGFSTTALPTGWVALDGGGKLNLVTTWQNKTVAVNVAAGNYYLVLVWRNDGGGGTTPPAAVDNVSITKMACPYDVEDLAVTPASITTTGATLTWTAGGATQWQVAYSTASDFTGATEEIVSTASYNMTGLTHSTTYYVRVRAYCGGSDFGSWCNAISFPTECEPTTIDADHPYTENFDSYTTGNNVLPICWSYINTTTYTNYQGYPKVYNYNSHSTSNSLYFYSYYSSSYDPQPQYAILPQMNGLDNARIKLWARGSNATSTFKIGRMTDPTDASTFVAFEVETGVYEQALTTSYQEFTYNLTGTGDYIAIMIDAATSSRTSNGVYIDDITVEEIPNCLEPTDLVFNSSTTTTAEIEWTAGPSGETAWDIYYNTTGVAPTASTAPSVTATHDNPATLTGLTHSTTYYVWVRAHCSDANQSPWIGGIHFNTACEARTIDALNHYTENFDSYSGSTSSTTPTGYPDVELPICWQFLNRSTTSTTYPQAFISSANGYPVSGNCLFFKSSSTDPLYAILPEFTNNISDLMLTFTYRNESVSASNGTLYVSYMTNPADATTFNTTDAIECTQTTTLTEMEVFFENAPAGSYIAFKYQGGSSNNYYLSIDNVSVQPAPTCRKPSGLMLNTPSAKTAHTATLKWNNGESTQNAWQIAYSTDITFAPADNFTPNGTTEWLVDVTANPATLTNLAANTTYYAYVRANCGGGDYSAWCTNKYNFTTVVGNAVPTGLAYDPASLTSSDVTVSWTGVATNDLHASYELYISTTNTAPTAETPATFTGITAETYDFTGLTAEETYYVWVRDNCGADGNSAWSSSITFTMAAACQTPDGLAATAITNSSATITWNPYGQSGFNLRYSDDNGTTWTTIPDASTPQSLTSLTGNTTYTVQVQAQCNTAAWSSSITFTTKCDPITTFPWNENFDGTTAPSVYTPSSRVLPTVCWSYINTCTNSTYKFYPTMLSYSSSTYAHSGSNYLRFYSYYASDAQPQYAILPAMDGLDSKRIKLYARGYNTSSTFKIGRMTDPADASTFVAITEQTNLTTSYQEFSYILTGGTGNYIAIMIDAATSTRTYNGVYIDDLTVEEIPSCLEPSNLAFTNITSNTADISWTAGASETAWDIYYSNSDAAPTAATTPLVNATVENPATIDGLDPATTYYVWVRAHCSATDQSAWIGGTSFTTACNAKTVPYFYDFETATDFTCWNPVAGAAIYSNSSQAHESTYFLKFSGTTNNMIALPQFTVPTNTLQIEFWTRPESATNSSCGNFAVGYMTDLSDATTFVAVESYVYNNWSSDTYEKKTVNLDAAPAGAYIAFRQYNCTSSWYWFVDDVTVREIPNCLAPTAPIADNITTDEAELSWTAENGETQWTVYYKLSTDATYTEVPNVTSNPYTLTGLTPATTYEYYVVANCSATDESYASDVFTFTTACEAITTFPWNENFDGYSLTSASTPSSRTLPICWNYINTSTNSTNKWYPTIYYYSYTNYANSSPNSVRLYVDAYSGSNYDPQDQYLILPEMTNIAGLRIKLQARASSTSSNYDATFKVGVMTNPADASTFTEIDEITPTTTTYELYTIPFNSYTGTGTYIAIMVEAPETPTASYTHAYRSVFIDDITVEEIPNCLEPSDHNVTSTTTTTATLGWTENGTATQWQICLNGDETNLIDAPSTDASINVSGTTVTCELSGLTPATNYTVKVRAYCSATDQSPWSNVIDFTTECEPFTITETAPYTQDFEAPVVTSTYNSTTGLKVPNCWENPYTTGSNVAGKPHLVGTGVSYNYATSGQVLLFYGSGNNYVTLPEFTNALNTLQISFKWATESASYGTLTLGYITAADDGTYNTFTAIKTYPASSDSYHVLIQAGPVYLDVPDDAARIAFRWYYSGQYSCNIDDLEVSLLPGKQAVDANKWYAIASPAHDAGETYESVANVTNLATGTYDFLRYNESAHKWESQKSGTGHTGFDAMEAGRGYIYRTATAATLAYTGLKNSAAVTYPLTVTTTSGSLAGWNLVGNPYSASITRAANVSLEDGATIADGGLYVLNPRGTWEAALNTTPIAAGKGFLVKATHAGTMRFSAPSSAKGAAADAAHIVFTVSDGEYSDVAYALFAEGQGLPKIAHLVAEAPVLSIPMGGGDYAIAMLEESVEQFPLSFNGTGEYTLSVEDNAGCSYLHLVDRATGRDIDLLSQPAYSFRSTGATGDRFTVKLTPTDDLTRFVWQDGGRVVVNGTGELQVFDVMGRQLGATHVEGTTTLDRHELGMVHSGVYVMRLNGNSQKIVVK